MARALLPIAGAVIGGIVGGPTGAQIGWAAGSIIAAVTSPGTKNVQPRLSDLKVTTAAYGGVLPYLEGAYRYAGWLAWASERRAIEHSEDVGGKGGPKVENVTYTYETDCLFLLTSNPICGVRRIWQDGELVWSKAGDFESINASSAFCRRVTVYTGADEQLPDPTYEAAVGIGNAPAYRRRGSVFLEGWDLGASGQIRNLTFEVYTEANTTAMIETPWRMVADQVQPIGVPAFRNGGFDLHIAASADFYGSNGAVNIWRCDVGEAPRLVDGYYARASTASNVGAEGSTDIDGLMLFHSGILSMEASFYHGRGGIMTMQLMEALDVGGKFAKRGNAVVLGTSTIGGTTTGKLYRYQFPVGSIPVATSAPLPGGARVRSLAISDGKVYAYALLTEDLFVLDLASMALVATMTVPTGTEHLLTDTGGALMAYTSTTLYRLVAGQWFAELDGLDAFGTLDTHHVVLGYDSGTLYGMFRTDALNIQIDAAWDGVEVEAIPLDQAVARLGERASIQQDRFDASALSIKSTRGFILSQVMSVRGAIDMLGSAYFFEGLKDDGIRFVNRGGDTVKTIDYTDLATIEGGSDNGEPLMVATANDIELPAYIAIKYANIAADYQEATEMSDRLVSESTEVRVLECPIAMHPDEARQLATVMAQDLLSATVRVGPIALQHKHAALLPTDCVQLTAADGSTFRTRLVKRDETNGVISFEGVLDDATAITSDILSDDDYTSIIQVRLPSRTDYELLDVPLLRDVDDGPGIVAAFSTPNDDAWKGAVLYGGIDQLNLEQLITVNSQTVIGACLTALGTWNCGNRVDFMNSVVVQVDGELESITRNQMLNGQGNACAITSAGRTEVLHFQNATLLGAGVYRLDTFARYRKGTEGVTHAIGDRFVLLQINGVRKVALELQRRDQALLYKAVSVGRPLSSVEAEPFTWRAVNIKPLSPVQLRAKEEGANTRFTMRRRTRLNGTFMTMGNDGPLGELIESYDFELRNATDALIASTTSSTPEWVYPATRSSLAGWSLTGYQRSSTAGRGFPAILEL